VKCEVNLSPKEMSIYRTYHPVCKECNRMGKAPRVVRKTQNKTDAAEDI